MTQHNNTTQHGMTQHNTTQHNTTNGLSLSGRNSQSELGESPRVVHRSQKESFLTLLLSWWLRGATATVCAVEGTMGD